VDRRRDVRIEFRPDSLRPPLRYVALDLVPDLGRDGRTQVEIGHGRAQVEPGPSDHDRPATLGHELVDLRVG
jgi:hypothetical protein